MKCFFLALQLLRYWSKLYDYCRSPRSSISYIYIFETHVVFVYTLKSLQIANIRPVFHTEKREAEYSAPIVIPVSEPV